MPVRRAELEWISLSCAAALQDRYPPGLVPHVEAVALGGFRAGRPDHMNFSVGADTVIGLAELLVSTLSLAVGCLSLRPSRQSGKGEPAFEGDLTSVERRLDEAIAELGTDQRPAAKRLKKDVLEWLASRTSTG